MNSQSPNVSKQPSKMSEQRYVLVRRRSTRQSVFMDFEQVKRMKEQRKEKIAQFIKKYEESKSHKVSTSDVIEKIYNNQREATEVEINVVSARILLNKDQYTEYKKDIQNRLLKDEIKRFVEQMEKKYGAKYVELMNDKEKERFQDLKEQQNEKNVAQQLVLLQQQSQEAQKEQDDIIDKALKQGINIKVDNRIKDSDYIVGICNNDKYAFLNYKKKNFLRNKDRVQSEIVSKMNRLIQHKQEILESKQRSTIKRSHGNTKESMDGGASTTHLNSQEFQNRQLAFYRVSSGEILVEGDPRNEQESENQSNTEELKEPDDQSPNIQRKKQVFSSQGEHKGIRINITRPKSNNLTSAVSRFNFNQLKKHSQADALNKAERIHEFGQRVLSDNGREKDTQTSSKMPHNISFLRASSQQKHPNINTASNSFIIEKPQTSKGNQQFPSNSNMSFLFFSKNSANQASDYTVGSPILSRSKLYQTFMQGQPTVASIANKNRSTNCTPQGKFGVLRKQMLSRIQNKNNVQECLMESKNSFNLITKPPSRMDERPFTQANLSRTTRNQYDYEKQKQYRLLSNNSNLDSNDNLNRSQLNESSSSYNFHRNVKNQLKLLRKNCNSVIHTRQVDKSRVEGIYNRLREYEPGNEITEILDIMPDSNPIPKYDQLLIQEDIRKQRFDEAVEQIQGMDLVDIQRPQTMQSLLKYRIQEKNDVKIEGVLVEGEYRMGINDPSRVAAQWEKVKGIKKIVGRKAIVDEFMKRVQGIKDNNLNLNFKDPTKGDPMGEL
ncbi:UNKNOWN [Stylonychia lemnae]|uniref:Uncharacterized protein n=1 Tax=Stylonychia lemnae TaxID=5949 RepID=A0A078A073_STYLE|nr:UNKNOWN [Stylonychia lemnae]|eukprot:CDW74823.1 UNKNOWN [Stylonychia lemnae]